MSDDVATRNDGTDEVVIPAPCAVTIYVQGGMTAAGDVGEVDPRLLVGWNADGSPIVLGEDGGLRLLDDGEAVTDVAWDSR